MKKIVLILALLGTIGAASGMQQLATPNINIPTNAQGFVTSYDGPIKKGGSQSVYKNNKRMSVTATLMDGRVLRLDPSVSWAFREVEGKEYNWLNRARPRAPGALKVQAPAAFPQAKQQKIVKITPSVAALYRLAQPSTATIEPARSPSGPGTRAPVRAQASSEQRFAAISEQPAVLGSKITITSASQPIRVPAQERIANISESPAIKGTMATTVTFAEPEPQIIPQSEEIIRPAPLRIALPIEGTYSQGTVAPRTGFVAKPQQVGIQTLAEPQYGAVLVPEADNSVRLGLEAAAKRAQDAAERLRQQVNVGMLSQEEQQKMLIDAVQKSDLALVRRIIEGGFKDDGQAIEEAELFALDVDDQNAQQILMLLREAAGLSDLDLLEQELLAEREQ